ncbi:MAG: hypothetical protein Q9166_003472 [cf. Caloplaca sp. 2 TL-2023]
MAQAPRVTIRHKLVDGLGVAAGVAAYATVYVAFYPLRPVMKHFHSPVPEEVQGRKTKPKRTNRSGRQDEEAPPVIDKSSEGMCMAFDVSTTMTDGIVGQVQQPTGYLSLPFEIRRQILEEALSAGQVVWPYRGLTAHERWQEDCKLATAAQRQAWKRFMRHPSTMHISTLFSVSNCYYAIIFQTPAMCIPAIRTAPHFLSTCHTAYDEGHQLFYSKNIFFMPHGPLSNAKDYYDDLQPHHKRLIRHMVIDLTLLDLTIESFNDIESQLRSKDVANNKLARDDSIEDWVAPVVYNILSTWRSKLAYLREWTWLEDLEIHCFLQANRRCRNHRIGLPIVEPFTVKGRDLQRFLKGVGPAEPHVPLMDCYAECDSAFGKQMRHDESFIWRLVPWMLEMYGWKCMKAVVRRGAYKELEEHKRVSKQVYGIV